MDTISYKNEGDEKTIKITSSVRSPSSPPPAPPPDSASSPSPPPDSAPPPDNSSENAAPPPVNNSFTHTAPINKSWPKPEWSNTLFQSMFPPLTSFLPPSKHSPPAESPSTDSKSSPPPPADSPPTDSNDYPPPPTSKKSASPPPADIETPPAPTNQSDSSPPPPDVQSPPPPSSSTKPETPPSESPPPPPTQPTNSPPPPPTQPPNSPPPPPTQPTNSPPAPPTQPTKSSPLIQPSEPANSPPAHANTPPSPLQVIPPRPNGGSGGPVASPSLTVPQKETPPTTSGNVNGYQAKTTVVGMAVAGFAVMALIAVVFLLVRRKKKRNIDSSGRSQYLPHSNFSVKADGFLYGQDPGKGYSGPGGPMYNSQQQSSKGNSYVSQRGQHQRQPSADSAILGTGQTHFSYDELAEITLGFSRQNILGEGGFGCVYKGTLRDGKLVAVKQLKAGSGQGDREFKAEVEIISRVHHRHLVSLVGYCISDPHRLLIYEFVSNQTLEHHLHGKGMPVLEWSKRVRIAIGSAKGLAYLHEDCNPKIIHRDIKSANILLDDVYEAQVADFGLARLNDTTQTHVSTRVMGTFGYLAPEYANSGKLTDRSDVFSFGVVLLELVTGRKPVDQDQPLGEESLVEWARPLLLKAIETGDISEVIDKRLGKRYVEHEVITMIETAAACVRHSGPKRPRMVQVVRALDCDGFSGDISNGIKVGQSTAYDSGKYNQEIMKFREMAFGFDDSSELGGGLYSGDYSLKSSSEFSANESESRPLSNQRF